MQFATPKTEERINRGFRLIVTTGPDAGQHYRSFGGRVVIGSHESVDLVLSDDRVANYHCELVWDDAGVVLRDVGSPDGIRVGNLTVRAARLEGALTFEVGDTAIRFEQASDDGQPAGPDDPPPAIDPDVPLKTARVGWVRYFEHKYLSALLESTGQNVSAAARKAGIDRVHLHRLLRNAGLRGNNR